MKITSIKSLNGGKYELTLEPTRLERFFGYKKKTLVLKDTGNSYLLGNQNIYMDSSGNKTGNGSRYASAIDKWRRKQSF